MTNFIDTHFAFPPYPDGFVDTPECLESLEHCQVFTVSYRSALINKELGQILRNDCEPEVMQKNLKDLVERVRPKLSGCWVVGCNYDIYCMSWQILVIHESLPKFDDIVPSEPLVQKSLIPEQDYEKWVEEKGRQRISEIIGFLNKGNHAPI
jgi:hypothetical protein